MASARFAPLIQIGPSKSLDTSSAGDYVAAGDGVVAQNVSTDRVMGGLTNARGRQVLYNYPSTYAGFVPSYIINVFPYQVSATQLEYIVTQAGSNVGYSTISPVYHSVYNPAIGTPYVIQPIGSSSSYFDQAIEFYGVVYMNNGTQYSYIDQPSIFNWHYTPIAGVMVNSYTTSATPVGNGGLAANYTYSYLTTTVVTPPSNPYIGGQETSPLNPLTPAQIYTASVPPYVTVSLSPTGTTAWSGEAPDGSTYVTYLYRSSTAQPVYYYVATLTGNGPYIDSYPDATIAANAQLILNRDPPIASPTNLVAIFAHQERAWNFGLYKSSQYTDNQTQCQLLFSTAGRPWEFDYANGVILVGSSTSTQTSTYSIGFGDIPQAGLSLGSSAILFKTQTTWLLTGDDELTYNVFKLFDMGCIARRSPIVIQGIVYWLSEYGAYSWSGAAPTYLSAKVKNTLNSLGSEALNYAVSSFSGNTWYLSFPTAGITLAYYTITGDWRELPYSMSSVAMIPASPADGTYIGNSGTKPNLVVGARADTTGSAGSLDYWNVADTDLGTDIIFTWASPLSSSGAPQTEKEYCYVTVLAPLQAGTVIAELFVDGNNVLSYPIDLSTGQTRHIVAVPGPPRGFQAQLYLICTNAAAPLTIYSATVWGTVDRPLVIPN